MILVRREGIEILWRAAASHTDTLHTVINNAGSVSVASLEALAESDWDRVVDINLKAVFFITQKLLPLLRKAASPSWPASIINIGSNRWIADRRPSELCVYGFESWPASFDQGPRKMAGTRAY